MLIDILIAALLVSAFVSDGQIVTSHEVPDAVEVRDE